MVSSTLLSVIVCSATFFLQTISAFFKTFMAYSVPWSFPVAFFTRKTLPYAKAQRISKICLTQDTPTSSSQNFKQFKIFTGDFMVFERYKQINSLVRILAVRIWAYSCKGPLPLLKSTLVSVHDSLTSFPSSSVPTAALFIANNKLSCLAKQPENSLFYLNHTGIM